jgi:hypothetical protein
MGNDEIQVFCLTSDEGHVWMHSYDALPAPVRRRLRNSPYNCCAACLEAFVLPKVQSKHPNWPREKALFAAIEVMEAKIRREQAPARDRGGIDEQTYRSPR